MKDRRDKLVLFLFGSLACLASTSIVTADGRLFVLNLENSTGLMGFREAQRACASLHARLASSAELRHAVVECFFSTCTRGWLYGGTVGTTVCNAVGGALKAVEVKTENATEDFAHLNAFCLKDRGAPCGDPPSFPNARRQAHSGYEMGDELLYTCVPGFVMPSGHRAFSLLCDSCGEWYGMVEMCVKDESEGLVDYEDKFPDTYGGVEEREQRAEEAQGEVQEEVRGAAHTAWKPSQQHQETTFSLEQAHRDVRGEGDVAANGAKEEEKDVGEFTGHPMSEQEPGVTADAATEAPVSLLSQKHMFWFPSEAFQDEVTQRDSTIQSEESKENESQEMNNTQKPIDPDDSHQESDHRAYHDTDDHDDHDSHHERDTQDYGDRDDQPKPYTPAQHEVQGRLDHPRHQDDGDEHYDMGEHDDDHSPTRYEGQEIDDLDDTYDEHDSYEDREDETEDRGDDDQQHLDDSQEHPDHDEDQYNQKEDDRHHHANTGDDDHNDGDNGDLSDDHDDHVDGDRDDPSDDRDDHDDHDDDDPDDHGDDHDDRDDHDEQHHSDDHDDLGDAHDDHDDYDRGEGHDDLTDRTDENDHGDGNDPNDSDDHDDQKDQDHDSYEDPDSHEDVKDDHVIFSITRDRHQNVTEMGDGVQATTDETWLDGYPVVATEAEKEDSMVGRSQDEDKDTGAFSEVESHRPVSHTSLPEESRSSSNAPPLQQEGGQETWPGSIPTANPTLKSHRDHAASTHSWVNDLTQQSFINRDPAPPVHDGMEEHTMHNLPGESGERGEMEGEIGEMGCTGENCPPPASAGQSSKVASIIVVVCLVAIAVMVGVWCYRRQQQKSSVYDMNAKGQSQSRPAQQMEMQQKV